MVKSEYITADKLLIGARVTTIARDVRREHCEEKYSHPQTTADWLGREADAGNLAGKIVGAEGNSR